ncbi:MAG: ATP-binding protein [Planctomycetes bacterium]|nr:ATP-binding protein [Planctomycetota bacterium]
MRGAGKTNTARVMAEEMFAVGAPFVAIDPVGSWWGLRAGRDGKKGGLAVAVFGGRHGDVPLERGGGAIVADLVVEERLTCILDLSEFESEAAKKDFLLDFATRLYRKNQEPLHLFLEEADDYVPQRPMRDEARLLRAWENIVRRGRARGLGMTLITQRSAVVHKNVLTQVGTLIAMRTMSPQDRAAIREWVASNGARNDLIESLPELESGEAWVWSPLFLGKTERVRMRRSRTFDSGATPKLKGRSRTAATLAEVDLAAVKERMAATIESANAEDPRALRKEVARLNREIAEARKTARVERVEVPVVDHQVLDSLRATALALDEVAQRVGADTRELLSRLERLQRTSWSIDSDNGQRRNGVHLPRSPAVPQRIDAAGGGKLGKCERAVLSVLAQHPEGCEAGKLTLLSGYRWSGTFRNALSNLRTSGLIEGENAGTMLLTVAGERATPDVEQLPTGDDLFAYWHSHASIGKCERAILDALLASPQGLTGQDCAVAAGYEWSGTFRNGLSKLRTIGLIEGRGNGWIQLSGQLLGRTPE